MYSFPITLSLTHKLINTYKNIVKISIILLLLLLSNISFIFWENKYSLFKKKNIRALKFWNYYSCLWVKKKKNSRNFLVISLGLKTKQRFQLLGIFLSPLPTNSYEFIIQWVIVVQLCLCSYFDSLYHSTNDWHFNTNLLLF